MRKTEEKAGVERQRSRMHWPHNMGQHLSSTPTSQLGTLGAQRHQPGEHSLCGLLEEVRVLGNGEEGPSSLADMKENLGNTLELP